MNKLSESEQCWKRELLQGNIFTLEHQCGGPRACRFGNALYVCIFNNCFKCKLNTISSFPWYFTDAMNSFCCNPDDWCKHTKYTDVYSRYMRQTWGKSPFLGRLRGKSTSGNPEYMSMCTSGVVVVVLLFKWYCLDGR